MKKRWWKKDDGFSFVWLAMIIVVLIGMTGFGTDLGWLYLNASRAQKAADAAAMAGVVDLPGFPALAVSDAEDAARANGYDPGGADTLNVNILPENRLNAVLETTVEPFFIKILGFNQFNITREATAQYVKPVPLGSPDPCFGQDPTGKYCTPNTDDFWAAVSAPYTRKHDGDPYSTNCVANSSASSCAQINPDYARAGSYGGYYYAVDLPVGASNLVVEVYDARWDERPNYPDIETADARYSPGGGGNPGVTTTFQMHAVDTTPSDPTDNPAIGGCGATFAGDTIPSNSAQKNAWTTLCTIANPIAGIYVLHVQSSGIGSGSNHYSIGASTSGPQPRVYGINDMSIFSNNLTGATKLYLVEIDPVHAGKKLELQFFDAGDSQGFSSMAVKNPFGVTPNCTYEVWNHSQTSLISGPTNAGCSWITSNPPNTQIFNNQWITAIIDLPDDPAMMCNGALPAAEQCFWFMELDLDDPNERTTWRARVIGNPVRLLP
ncbi:MAG: pilus assembly protein TadG-related protein [Acidimicrobiia bacterium]